MEFTARFIPGYPELDGDLFKCRKQKKKGYPYAPAHCISADAAMAAGIAVDFCEHFSDLRHRVESETHRRATLIAIFEEDDQSWIYNLVTKDLCFEKLRKRDLRECLLLREHATQNRVLAIRMPRLAAD